MRSTVARGHWAAVAYLVLLSGCDSLFGSDPKISLTPSATSVTVGQGAATTVTLAIGRDGYKGSVNLSVDGAPEGVSTALSTSIVPNGTASVTLTITASGGAVPGDFTLTVRATGDGVAEQTATIDVSVTTTGSFGLSVLEPSVSVAQGGGGTATVLVPRFENNAGNVTIGLTNLPTGVSVSITPSPTTTSSAKVAFSVTDGATPGTYPLSVTASSPGFADQSATFSLVVTTPPSTASLTVSFCADDMPAWFAYRNQGYAWQRVTPSGSAFTFAATDLVSIAFAYPSGDENQMQVISATRAELDATNDAGCGGSRTLSGSVTGLSATQSARLGMGDSRTSVPAGTPGTFVLSNLSANPLDLVAVRGLADAGFTPDRVIVRRSVDAASGSTLPVLDFAAAESFAPATNTLSITGLQSSDQVDVQNAFWSVTSTVQPLQQSDGSAGSLTLYSVPSANMVSEDVHELFVDAYTQTSGSLLGHSYAAYFAAATDRSDAVGPIPGSPVLNTVTTSPYARMRARVTVQPEYNTSVQFGFYQVPESGPARYTIVGVSAGYLGSTPAQWDVVIPDFTSTEGFTASWMLIADEPTAYIVQPFSGRTELLFGGRPVAGDLVRFGYRVGSFFTSQVRAASLRAGSMRLPRPTMRQYFRR